LNLDDLRIDEKSFAWKDIQAQDAWTVFTPSFTSLTLVGAATYTGRFHVIGKQCFFQVTLLAVTSIASTAGTTYMSLPITARGISGDASMGNLTTNVSVGTCVIDATNGRCYLPSQVASGNTFSLAGWWEV
jgi:hypothetical protein